MGKEIPLKIDQVEPIEFYPKKVVMCEADQKVIDEINSDLADICKLYGVPVNSMKLVSVEYKVSWILRLWWNIKDRWRAWVMKRRAKRYGVRPIKKNLSDMTFMEQRRELDNRFREERLNLNADKKEKPE